MEDLSNHEFDEKTEFFSPLPNEIMLKIFGHLEINDVIHLNLVCKRWHSLSNEDALWRRFVPKYPGVDLPKAKTQQEIFQKLWSDSVQIGKERWFPNPLPSLVEYNTSLQKYNEENIPGEVDKIFSLSRCMLYLRLNPLYAFTTDGIKQEDPLMQEIVHQLSDKLGKLARPGYECDDGVDLHDAKSAIIYMTFPGNRKFAMELIVGYCYDFRTNEQISGSMIEQLIDDEGHILEQKLNDNEPVGNVFKGMSVSKRLFNQIWNIVVDKNDRFIIYNVKGSYRNKNEELLYPRQILVTDTAVVYCARREFEVN
ncbi:S-phase kinase-associated 2 [Paramuricea clavata]|uniref:S-phase kinase-associated 2, partial n=1 Tax=Paramuricea clavata TaxID=317549 RepID=A0A6S7IW54_PARCT|nr:S-phase kinase-associated 2 [Paramuricea clavata]